MMRIGLASGGTGRRQLRVWGEVLYELQSHPEYIARLVTAASGGAAASAHPPPHRVGAPSTPLKPRAASAAARSRGRSLDVLVSLIFSLYAEPRDTEKGKGVEKERAVEAAAGGRGGGALGGALRGALAGAASSDAAATREERLLLRSIQLLLEAEFERLEAQQKREWRQREQVSSFMYRYILRESCSQFDALPLTYF